MNTIITNINPDIFSLQDYTFSDNNIIPNFNITSSFKPEEDYVEYFIYDLNNQLLAGLITRNYSFSNDPSIIETGGYSTMNLNPERDLIEAGFDEGKYQIVYNFFKNQLSSNQEANFFIKEISPDRTELRLASNIIPTTLLTSEFPDFIQNLNSEVYFNEFYLNFGENKVLIGVNALLDNGGDLLIKLYEPLPPQFNLKDTLWIVTKVSDSLAFDIELIPDFIFEDTSLTLRGPNLNLNLNDQINNSTPYVNYTDLTSTNYNTGSRNLKYQLNSILNERGIEINVDYSDYNNFIYLSSAQTRLENFYYKLKLIEDYTINSNLSPTGSVSSSYTTQNYDLWQNKIDEIVTTFDGYEYYLYFESGSNAWPKSNNTYPYINVSTGSLSGSNWFLSQSLVAGEYDRENYNNLVNSIPQYLRDDSSNSQYEFFIEMLGEMFDNIWIYYKDVTNKWDADNRLNYGVSKDLVATILKDLGLKIYQNSFSSMDLYTALLGVTPDGDTFPFPFITGSLPVLSGYEYINTKISASNEVIPLQDIEKSIYKRLYHNLPLLLKKKGTIQGLKDILNIYGIPSTILRINDFGSRNVIDNTQDLAEDRFNYAWNPLEGFLFSPWRINSYFENETDVPSSVLFRFKFERSLSIDIKQGYQKTLWELNDGGSSKTSIRILYTGSGDPYTPYSNNILDPYYQYGTLNFIPDLSNPQLSASLYLPFFNNEWWDVMITNNNTEEFILHAGSYINGELYYFSSSINSFLSQWEQYYTPYLNGYYPDIAEGPGPLYQEYRFYNTPLNEESFKSFIKDPSSIEGNGFNSGSEQLLFRLPLGNELYINSGSIHPRITGSWENYESFSDDTSLASFTEPPIFVNNYETVYPNEPINGIKNRTTDRIKIVDMILPSGSVLSKDISIQQNSPISESFTSNINQLEIAFSPQNEINDDIAGQIPGFNLGDILGDPRVIYDRNTSYNPLDRLREQYFLKYIHNYNIYDYIRLIKYFDNSLFKMIKDFTPAQTSLISGIVIKQHLLERNKYPIPKITPSSSIAYIGFNTASIVEDLTLTGSIGTNEDPIGNFTSTQGGAYADLSSSFNKTTITLNNGTSYQTEVGVPVGDSISYNLTQSFLGTNITPLGRVPFTQSNAQEFFNGELDGSNFIAEDGNLNGDNPYLKSEPLTPIYDLSSSILVKLTNESVDSLDIAYQDALTQLYNTNVAPGTFAAAFVYEPFGEYSGSYTVSMSFNNLYKMTNPPYTNFFYALEFDQSKVETSVGSGGAFNNSTLNTPSGYILYSASFNGDLTKSPFYYDITRPNDRTLSLLYSGSSGVINLIPSGTSYLLTSSINPNYPSPSGIGTIAFSQSAADTTDFTITLHYRSLLKYYFVGVKVNNIDDTSTDYTTLLSQCQSFLFNLTDVRSTRVSVGTYINSQPTNINVTPINRSTTMLNVGNFNRPGGGNEATNPIPSYNLRSFLINLGFNGDGSNIAFVTSSNQNILFLNVPGVNEDLTYSNYNAILNNALDVEGAQGYYDLDYSQGSLTPVNYDNIINAIKGSGSATLAPIQDYNWNLRRSIIPRYSGSKVTSKYYNIYTPVDNDWSGDESYGKTAAIDNNSNIAFNIDYIQGAYPEMANGTIINVKNIGIFNSENPSNITLIDQNTPSTFNFLIDQYLGYSQSSQIFSNDTSPILGNNLITLDGTIGWPINSSYFIPRQQTISQSQGIFYTSSWAGSIYPNGGILFSNTSSIIYPQSIDSNGRYITASLSSDVNLANFSVVSTSLFISSSISRGEDWYITLYTGSAYPLPTFEEAYAGTNLSPYNSGSLNDYSKTFSLASQGIYKIKYFGVTQGPSAPFSSPYIMELDRQLPDSFKGIGSGSLSGPNSSLSMLIWKSNNIPQSIVIKNRLADFPSGIGEKGGYVIPDGFNNDLRGVLSIFRENNTPILGPKGELKLRLQTEISNSQTANALAGVSGNVNPIGWVPLNRPGFFQGETQNFEGKTYEWVNNKWILIS